MDVRVRQSHSKGSALRCDDAVMIMHIMHHAHVTSVPRMHRFNYANSNHTLPICACECSETNNGWPDLLYSTATARELQKPRSHRRTVPQNGRNGAVVQQTFGNSHQSSVATRPGVYHTHSGRTVFGRQLRSAPVVRSSSLSIGSPPGRRKRSCARPHAEVKLDSVCRCATNKADTRRRLWGGFLVWLRRLTQVLHGKHAITHQVCRSGESVTSNRIQQHSTDAPSLVFMVEFRVGQETQQHTATHTHKLTRTDK